MRTSKQRQDGHQLSEGLSTNAQICIAVVLFTPQNMTFFFLYRNVNDYKRIKRMCTSLWKRKSGRVFR